MIALQETKLPDADFPVSEIAGVGFEARLQRAASYNGVAILARTPLTDVVHGIPVLEDDQKRVLAATVRGVRIIDVYVPNGQALDSPKYPYKLALARASAQVPRSRSWNGTRGSIVLGDYNIAPEDRDVHDPKAWEGACT